MHKKIENSTMLRLGTFMILLTAILGKNLGHENLKLAYYDNFEIENRIVGGQLADDGEYPSMASLMNSGNHLCGATIISETFLASAAHCNPEVGAFLNIRVGTNKWNETGTDHELINVIIHPNWDPLSFASSDIALIEVSPPIIFNEKTQPAVLPSQDQETTAGSDAIIVGWGMISNNDPERPIDLREGFVNIRDHQECYGIYEAEVEITDAQLCADVLEGGVGTCGGDSGGPIYVNGEFIGIASWISRGCGIEGFPGVFTRIASYRDWITENTGI